MANNDGGGFAPGISYNVPLYALGSAVIFVAFGVVLVVTGHDTSVLLGVLISTIPSFLAAAFAERNAKDIRNGVIQDKARQGTHQALQEANVVTRDGPTVMAALQSLTTMTETLQHIITGQKLAAGIAEATHAAPQAQPATEGTTDG